MTREDYERRQYKKRMREKKRRQQRAIRIGTIAVALLIIVGIIIGITACVKHAKNKNGNDSADAATTLETETTTETFHAEVNLVAVGDVLMHTPLLNYASNGDGTYDFSEIFSVMQPYISQADLAVCNQETPINTAAEPDGGISFIFNTPSEIGDAEINAGFDLILQSSNHCADQGEPGIINTVAYWKTKAGLATMIGMYDSQESRDETTILEINGIKIAVFNYTYGLNGNYLPLDTEPYLTTILEDDNKDKIVSEIQAAKQTADFVIIFPHWGTEDVHPGYTDFQAEWGQIFADAGADLIIGTHPHVCEEIDWLTGSGGNKCLCYYSIGNFASNQQETAEVLGGMAKVKIVKDGDTTYIDESATGVVPVVTQNWYLGNFTDKVVVYPLASYTEELAAEHDIAVNGRDATFSYQALHDLANETFGDWIMDP